MILVKRKYLYIMFVLFSMTVIIGEIKFFYAINRINLAVNMNLKYEVESFIFAFITVTLLVYFLLFHFIGRSTNLLKRMDKLIELSEFGKYDVHSHLDKLGLFGEKIKYLLSHSSRLNDLKSLKISASSDIIRVLLKQIDKEIVIFDRVGNVLDYSNKTIVSADTGHDRIKASHFRDIFISMDLDELYSELDKSRGKLSFKNVDINRNSEKINRDVEFDPVINREGMVSNIVAVI